MEQWNLKSLKIEYQVWGEFKGQYIGKVEFASGDTNAFSFSLSQEETANYLEIISKTVCKTAAALGDKIVESMKFLPTPDKPLLEIQPSKPKEPEAKEIQAF